MYIFKLAYRNLFGKGLRSWLNFLILSFAYVAIIWMQGFIVGMQHQASRAMIQEEIASGQYWADGYDPYNPYSLDNAFVKIPSKTNNSDVPILMSRAIAYPQGQMRAVILKGIKADQKLLTLPTDSLEKKDDEITGFIGTRMARDNNIKLGDRITVRWKNANGAYDATEIRINRISKFQSSSVDNNQIWISYENMQNMMKTENCATIIVKDFNSPTQNFEHWKFKDHKLVGNYLGCRECHPKPDLLLVYRIHQDILELALTRVGNHSELFN
jgi:addiction module RelE/StbE family toxin